MAHTSFFLNLFVKFIVAFFVESVYTNHRKVGDHHAEHQAGIRSEKLWGSAARCGGRAAGVPDPERPWTLRCAGYGGVPRV